MNASFPILYWPKNASNADYKQARIMVMQNTNMMPEVICGELDIAQLFKHSPDAVLYYPVFCESNGWWGELLGGDASIVAKHIISPECQLMQIEKTQKKQTYKNHFLAAEVYPATGFFKNLDNNIGMALDMLATDSGTVLALFVGNNQKKFINSIEQTKNIYLGSIGGY